MGTQLAMNKTGMATASGKSLESML